MCNVRLALTPSGFSLDHDGSGIAGKVFAPGTAVQLDVEGPYILFTVGVGSSRVCDYSKTSENHHSGFPYGIRWLSGYGHNLRHISRPYFQVDDFDLEGKDYCWLATLPPAYCLPWNKHRTFRSNDNPEKALEMTKKDLLARLVSAKEYKVDIRSVLDQVPDWARKLLRGRPWAEVVQEADL